jgi:hypothetical protein
VANSKVAPTRSNPGSTFDEPARHEYSKMKEQSWICSDDCEILRGLRPRLVRPTPWHLSAVVVIRGCQIRLLDFSGASLYHPAWKPYCVWEGDVWTTERGPNSANFGLPTGEQQGVAQYGEEQFR